LTDMSTPSPAAIQAQASALLHKIPLGAPIVDIWFNGFYACLALATVWAIITKPANEGRQGVWLFLVILMFTVATFYSTMTAAFEMRTITEDGAAPGLIAAFEDAPIWYTAMGATLFSLNILIADCIIIWRCWVVWGRSWLIIILPSLATLAGVVLAVLNAVGEVTIVKAKGHVPGKVPKEFITFNKPYSILSLVTSLYATLLIIARIVMVQRHVGSGSRFDTKLVRRYSKAIELVVESALLYSVNMLIFCIFTSEANPKVSFPEAILPQIAGIAPTLLLFRVMMGHARPDSNWTTQGSRTRTGDNLEFAGSETALGKHSVTKKVPGLSTTTMSGSTTRVYGSEKNPSVESTHAV